MVEVSLEFVWGFLYKERAVNTVVIVELRKLVHVDSGLFTCNLVNPISRHRTLVDRTIHLNLTQLVFLKLI
jgi:hypothetical protein